MKRFMLTGYLVAILMVGLLSVLLFPGCTMLEQSQFEIVDMYITEEVIGVDDCGEDIIKNHYFIVVSDGGVYEVDEQTWSIHEIGELYWK